MTIPIPVPPKPSLTRKEKAEDATRQSALALELPFTLVGAVLVGGGIGILSG